MGGIILVLLGAFAVLIALLAVALMPAPKPKRATLPRVPGAPEDDAESRPIDLVSAMKQAQGKLQPMSPETERKLRRAIARKNVDQAVLDDPTRAAYLLGGWLNGGG